MKIKKQDPFQKCLLPDCNKKLRAQNMTRSLTNRRAIRYKWTVQPKSSTNKKTRYCWQHKSLPQIFSLLDHNRRILAQYNHDIVPMYINCTYTNIIHTIHILWIHFYLAWTVAYLSWYLSYWAAETFVMHSMCTEPPLDSIPYPRRPDIQFSPLVANTYS